MSQEAGAKLLQQLRVMCAGCSDQGFSDSQAGPHIGVVQQGGMLGHTQPCDDLHAACSNDVLQYLACSTHQGWRPDCSRLLQEDLVACLMTSCHIPW